MSRGGGTIFFLIPRAHTHAHTHTRRPHDSALPLKWILTLSHTDPPMELGIRPTRQTPKEQKIALIIVFGRVRLLEWAKRGQLFGNLEHGIFPQEGVFLLVFISLRGPFPHLVR